MVIFKKTRDYKSVPVPFFDPQIEFGIFQNYFETKKNGVGLC